MNAANPYEPTAKPDADISKKRLTLSAFDAVLVASIGAALVWLFIPSLDAALGSNGTSQPLPGPLRWIAENVGTAFFVVPMVFSSIALLLFSIVRGFAAPETRARMPWFDNW